MIIDKNRLISYIVSLVIILIFLYIVPLNQIFKYILFIVFHYLLITSEIKNKLFFYKFKFLVLISIFILSCLFVNNLSLKFNFEINSFHKDNYDDLSETSKIFFKEQYPLCQEMDCFYKKDYDIHINDNYFRYHINIKNIHELRTNIFYSPGTALQENVHITKYNYPYEISFKFPNFFNGSKFCYENNNNKVVCKEITKKSFNYIVNGVGENITIYIEHSSFVLFSYFLITLYFSLLIYLILRELISFRLREIFEILYPISLIFWLVIFSLINDAEVNFLNAYFYQYPGGDGFKYLYLSNILSAYLINYQYLEFFKGGVEVFYFMPGMRYFLAIEKFIFGNSFYLHLIIFSFLPFLLKKLLSLYLSKKVTYIILFSFLLFPLMHHMGFSLYQYIRYSSKIFAEPIAYTIFIFGLIRIIYYFLDKQKFANTLPLTTIILSISCILRPNLAPTSFFLLIIPYVEVILQKKYKLFFLFSICGLVIFLPLLHNLYFGNQFVLFTTAVFSDANLKLTFSDYFSYISGSGLSEEKKIMLIEIIKNFFNPFEIHKYFILLGIFLSLNLKNLYIPKLYPLFIIIFSQFYLFLFLNPAPRYMWIFWLGALILSMYTFTSKKNIK